jgi:glycosyltransferase involved in cell wall biosynthesis
MKIVIATPFYPPEVGTLGTYAKGLEGAFRAKGHTVVVVSLGALRRLPPGLRHIAYGFRLLPHLFGATCILSLDTWTIAVPALIGARLTRVPFLVRIGGDMLWEAYVDRTHELTLLSEFYAEKRRYSFKERLISRFLHSMTRHAHVIFFNSQFQRGIWERAYDLPAEKMHVLENFYPERTETAPPEGKVFAAPVRGVFTKNPGVLAHVFARVQEKHPEISLDTKEMPHAQQLERLRRAYAVIIPSISEITSNMAIEAVSFGRPFIVSRDSALSERLEGCGLFVDMRSADEIERAIEQMLDPAVYEALAAKARAFSFVRSWDTIADDILNAAQLITGVGKARL